MTLSDDEHRQKVYELAMKISRACDQSDTGILLCALAVIGAQSVVGVAGPNNIPPKDVIKAFVEDLEEWTAKYIAFSMHKGVEAIFEKVQTQATEH